KRRHSRDDAVSLVERLHARRPEIAIGADLIAGFPTEDHAMHRNSCAIVEDLRIVHGHIFPYSPRPGTPAARMPQVHEATRKSRAADLRELVAGQRKAWLASLVGKPLEVVAEKDGTGHSASFAPVRLPQGTLAGSLITITPTRVVEGILE
ncbi:MAG: tRNA (N(6)-L-threonylcarbamoyladenosine(37)-C(2))-methylthiotransferase MtaB, partial [Novosphingobium sp.]|nr:tRNA (N(6)-L-threonylcarbamoyladenosine(37)-C(2))-methylthiotransferase MtaB [Novosphingobium sp.]